MFLRCNLKAQAVSISDDIKRQYATASGADLDRLLWDRAYKEQHRPSLTAFFQRAVRRRPQRLKTQFQNVILAALNMDVLLITGMRDTAPLAVYSHLVPGDRLLEVRVQARDQTRRVRRGWHGVDINGVNSQETNINTSDVAALDYRPSLIFDNAETGDSAAERFAERYLLPFFHDDLERLANMVRLVPDFPSPEIEFRHVLGISQRPGGLALCTSLLQSHFTGNWAEVAAIVCCEAGGFVFASALALRVNVPLVLIRDEGKLPPPTVSVPKPVSYVSSSPSNRLDGKRIEMERDAIPKGASVVVVDDVLSTGETLVGVLQLLHKAEIGVQNTSVMVVAELPFHAGRRFLYRHGFDGINVQSLLIFNGA